MRRRTKFSKPMKTGQMRIRQYRLDNRGEILVIQAFNKPQIKRKFRVSLNEISKYCEQLSYHHNRKIDYDLTKGEAIPCKINY